MIKLIQEGGYFGGKDQMDIYIVRKCKVELKEFPGSSGVKYKLPVMTAEDIHSYVFQEELTPEQRGKIQKDLEAYYGRGEVKNEGGPK